QQIKGAVLDDAGRLIVVWQSDGQDGDLGGIYARVFDPLGHPLTDELAVNQTTTGLQEFPTVAVDAEGDFLVAWSSDDLHGNYGSIYARKFNSAGQPLTDEFRVNESTAGVPQRYPTVAMDTDGDAIVTWSSFGQDGDQYGIYARRYNAAGQPEGHEFRVNTYTASDQLYSSVALDDDGDFVVVWSSQGQDGSGYGVYGQRYAVPRARQPGDADGDGDVDLNDLNAVRNHFGGAGPGIPGDTDDDGDVDLNDLNAVRNSFGATASGSASRTGPSYRATSPANGAEWSVESNRAIPLATASQSGGRQLAPQAADVLFGIFVNNEWPTPTQKPMARRAAFR
ncbi:MAG: hypothetical protein AB7I48_27925, partial [Planctomycetaceae bacterium]